MRTLLIVFSLLLGVTLYADKTPEVAIDSVVWYYKPEQAFKRIGEYLDGEERTGRKTIIRTQEDGERQGLYYVVRITEFADNLPAGCYFVIDLLQPDKKKPISQKFTMPADAKSHREIWLGFTGEDIPAENNPPVAWRVSLYSPTGEMLSEYKSFLWSKPPTETAAAE